MVNPPRFNRFIGAATDITILPPFMATITAHTNIRTIQGLIIADTVRGRPTIRTIDIKSALQFTRFFGPCSQCEVVGSILK